MFTKKQKKTAEDREKELAKARAKQRRKLIKTRYGQRQKKHAKKGIQSCLLAAAAAALIIMMLLNSFKAKGDISVLYGLAGFLVPVIAWRGLLYAVRGFNEREKNYIPCRIGAGCNGALLLCMCAIFIRGLF